MEYLWRKPTTQDEQFEMTKQIYSGINFCKLALFCLYCAGMGSGKSNIIANVPSFINFNGVVINVTKDINLMEQMKITLNRFASKLNMVILIGSEKDILTRIKATIRLGKQPIVLFCHLSSNSGKLSKTTQTFVDVLKNHECLVLIDEIDSIITNLTGGMNAKLDHSETVLKSYKKVKLQTESLNVFDKIRQYKAKVIGFTGTANNLVSSKLTSTGYCYNEIQIINMYPIKSIYKDIHIQHGDTDPENILELYQNEIKSVKFNEKILIVFHSENEIQQCIYNYKRLHGSNMSCVTITSENKDERLTDAWKEKFDIAKFVLGINLVGIGFDISTFCKGQEFGLVIICRKLSDLISQPLSKNRDHDLHMETSATMLQIMARMRKGGLAIIHESAEIKNFYNGMLKICKTIRHGRNEMLKVGMTRGTQEERQNQCILLALIQNIKIEGNRKIVIDIVSKLNEIANRDFEEEFIDLDDKLALREGFDPVYWTDRIGDVWNVFMGNDLTVIPHPIAVQVADKEITKDSEIQVQREPELPSHQKAVVELNVVGDYLTGGGERKMRIDNDKTREDVIERAGGNCLHCSLECTDGQMCHVKRNDHDGPFSLDNLGYGHVCCDSMYDYGFIVYDPDGGYWLSPVIKFQPDKKQWAQINPIYIRHRWDWERMRQGFIGKTNNNFREHLKGKNYSFQE